MGKHFLTSKKRKLPIIIRRAETGAITSSLSASGVPPAAFQYPRPETKLYDFKSSRNDITNTGKNCNRLTIGFI